MENTKKVFHFWRILYVLWDFLIIAGSILLIFAISNNFTKLTSNELLGMFILVIGLPLIEILIFSVTGIYKMLGKGIGLIDTSKMILITLSIYIIELILLFVIPDEFMPSFSVGSWVLSAVTCCALIPLGRLFARTKKLVLSVTKQKSIKTIIIGAGDAARIAINDARNNKDVDNTIVALVDDDVNKIGSTFSNIPVEGPISNIEEIIKKYNAEEVIIAIVNLSKERIKEIFGYLANSEVRVKRMPILSEMSGLNEVRIIDVDLEELLGRDPIVLNNKKVNEMLNGCTVLVTGAGGSIGSELVRQIFNTHPKTLILFDIYENCLYDIQMELMDKMRNEKIDDVELIALVGSTYNEKRVEQVLRKYRPDYIYHAAAYKHVPLMENSPMEAIRTNVIGTYNVARLADKYKVKKMVLVSTDKAVRPTNVMGATKRFAETIIQYYAEKSKNTYYAAVRFGNVLGSNGSVVPLFKKQIEAGGPITLTHKDIIRYFMTIPEAVSLILQCGLFATKGEIFILDMGKPVKILTLAEKLIRQAGLIPYKDIDIIETGLRPGEKLYEELLLDKKVHKKTQNSRIFVEEIGETRPIEEQIVEISKTFELDDNKEIKKMLSSIIETYTITENK